MYLNRTHRGMYICNSYTMEIPWNTCVKNAKIEITNKNLK